MPLRIRQSILRESIQRRHLDASAVRGPRRLSRVVVQNDEHVGCVVRGFLVEKRFPVRFGVADIEEDLTFEWP